MPRPYNKKTINDAITLCSVMPSERGKPWRWIVADLGLRLGDTSVRLATGAANAVIEALPHIVYPDMWPEAAALIESGWRIGDPVDLLKLPVEEETIPSPFNEARTDAASDSIPVEPEDDEDEPRPDPVADAIEAGDAETADEEMTSTYDDAPAEPTVESDPSLTIDQPSFEYGGEG